MLAVTRDTIAAELDRLALAYPGFTLATKDPRSGVRCTTWGQTVYVPSTWDMLSPPAQYIRLQHEAVHLAQFAALGTVKFMLKYLTFSGRRDLERAAFAAQMHTEAAIYGAEYVLARREYFIGQFTGSAYWYCESQRSAEGWVDTTLAAILAGV